MTGQAQASSPNNTNVRAVPVSVIIPVFNGAHFLPDAIASILRQNYPTLDIIVVDDGSSDDIATTVAALPTDVRFFRHESNLGPAAARNLGIREAFGEFIAFLDVDDMWTDNTLHTLVDALTQDAAYDGVLSLGQLVRVDPATGEIVPLGSPNEAFPYYVGCGLYRRDVFRSVGLFDETMRFAEDTDWYNRARESGLRFTVVRHVSLLVRRHETNSTRGRTFVELNQLRVIKNALDRRRAARQT